MISVHIQMSDSIQVNKRHVYSTMIFFGDVGGLYSSVFAIGALLHFFLVSENSEEHRQVMQHYFRVDSSGPKPS